MVKEICGQYADELLKNARLMVTPGKGLLAADESTSTIEKRFNTINVENTEENRRAYREMLFTAPDIEKYISGVIMYEETLFQKDSNGQDFTQLLSSKGILNGIKVDLGVTPIPGEGKNTVTNGFDGLEARCRRYYAQGARFAKWRAVIEVSEPSETAILMSAQGLARYAAICQSNGLVPIVEPETMVLEGNHSIEKSYEITSKILNATFTELFRQNVSLERMILKPNFVLPGRQNPNFASEYQRAVQLSLDCYRRHVPSAVTGIMFLSGGLTEKESVEILNNINKAEGRKPWPLSYSYGRGLQTSALENWRGKPENVKAGQEGFINQAIQCSKAERGQL